MYKAYYRYEQTEGVSKTLLRADFFLGPDTIPRNRKEVKKRYDLKGATGYHIKAGLDDFIITTLGYGRSCPMDKKLFGETYHSNNYSTILNIKPFKFKLGFRLTETSTKKIELTDMIDLDKLHHYCLTGETELPKKRDLQELAIS